MSPPTQSNFCFKKIIRLPDGNGNGLKTTLSIQEMAKGYYCPPPMFYQEQEVTRELVGGTQSEIDREFGRAYNKKMDIGNGDTFQPKRERQYGNFIGNDQPLPNDGNQAGLQNVIMLNSTETKKILGDKNFQLQLNGNNMLLDVILNELINLRGSGQATSDEFQKNFRMIVEHHNLGGGQADYSGPRVKKDQNLAPAGGKEAKVAFDGDALEKSQDRRHQGEKSKLAFSD